MSMIEAQIFVKLIFQGVQLTLFCRKEVLLALKHVGLEKAILAIGIPVEKRAIHTNSNSVANQYYGKEGEVIYSISRGLLNKKMVDLAEKEGVSFFFERKIWDVSLNDGTLFEGEEEHGDWTAHKYDIVLVQMVRFPELDIECKGKACLIILKNFNYWLQRITHSSSCRWLT